MYEQHFGLNAPLPAHGIARDARVYVRAPALRRLEHRLATALTRGNALVLLSGPPGSGKTTLAAHTVRTEATRLAFGWIAHAPRRPHDLLEQLIAEFGLEPEHAGRAGLLQTWQQFLSEMALTETAVCVLVENADELGPGVLRALESLTAADPTGCPGANLILMSRTSLVPLLRQPGLEGLAQRVSANLALEPLDAAATADYVEFALAACGGKLADIADEAAVRSLHAHAGGIIRVIDNLADAALALAAERGVPRVDAALVDEVAAELLGVEARARSATQTSTDDDADAVPMPGDATAQPGPDPTGVTDPTAVTDEVPVLTDAVDGPDDPLVRDVLASMAQTSALPDAALVDAHDAAPVDVHVAVDVPGVASREYGHGDVPDDAEAELDVDIATESDDDDAQSETFEGIANALAFEDFSNHVAESVFGADELDELSQTLAVADAARPERKLTGT